MEFILIGIVGVIVWGFLFPSENRENTNYPTPSLKDSDGD